jgi:hypothetical protein
LTGNSLQYDGTTTWTCSGNFPAVASWPPNWLATPEFKNVNGDGVYINDTVTPCNVVNMTENGDSSLVVSFTVGGTFILRGAFMATNFTGSPSTPMTINGNITYVY